MAITSSNQIQGNERNQDKNQTYNQDKNKKSCSAADYETGLTSESEEKLGPESISESGQGSGKGHYHD